MSERPPESPPHFVTCHCEHCGGGIEFDATQLEPNLLDLSCSAAGVATGLPVPCPHCGLETLIRVPEEDLPPVVSDGDFHLRNAKEVEGEEELRKTGILAEQQSPSVVVISGNVHAPSEGLPPVISGHAMSQSEDNLQENLFLPPSDAAGQLVEERLSKPPASFNRIGEDEEIIQQCIEIIRREKKASATLLNEQLPLGYNRAAQILEELAKRGIVGPFKYGDAPRDILIDLNNGRYLRGDASWQTDLGCAYFREKKFDDAEICFAKAAEQGNPQAQFLLGLLCFEGFAFAGDQAEAMNWWRKAADQGHSEAQNRLGLAYWKGDGVPKNAVEALKWLRKAAELGHVDAQFMLGVSYADGEGVAQNYLEAYKWLKLAAERRHEGACEKSQEIVLKMNAEQIKAIEPDDQLLWKRDRLTLKRLSDFVGQNRIMARLELAIAAARSRHEALHHILLIGPPGSGKATLASVIAKVMGSNIKAVSSPTITKSSDLAGLLTNLEEGDVLFIEEIHRLPRIIEEYLYPAMQDFKLDVIIDQGPNARQVRLNLPRFTLIGSTTTKERLTPNLLSCFRIIEEMDDYSIEELAAIAQRFATSIAVEIDTDVTNRIARSADGTPIDVLNRFQHVRDFAHVKGYGRITLEVTESALKLLASFNETQNVRESREAIPSTVRREVWRRDEGKCVKCGSRKNLEYDHIIPVAEGGSNTARNIELLCEVCNRAKSDLIQ